MFRQVYWTQYNTATKIQMVDKEETWKFGRYRRIHLDLGLYLRVFDSLVHW